MHRIHEVIDRWCVCRRYRTDRRRRDGRRDENPTEQHATKPLCLVTIVFGDVARFVDGSLNACAVSYIGICENYRGGL